MGFHQIARKTGEIKRVPRGETPVIELDLDSHVRVISARLSQDWESNRDLVERKTCDWSWEVYLDNDLEVTAYAPASTARRLDDIEASILPLRMIGAMNG